MNKRKLTQSDKRLLKRLRNDVEKEKKRLKITEPKFTISCDVTTKRIRLNYSIPIDMGIDANNNRIIKKKQKNKYLKDVMLIESDFNYVIQNIKRYADDLLKEIESTYYSIGNDKDNINYWKEIYCTNPYRKGNVKLTDVTLLGDEFMLRSLIDYLQSEEPEMLNVWKWIGNGRKCLERFMKHKQTIINPKTKKAWSNASVNCGYVRIRAFFNWLPDQLEGFPMSLLNRMPFTPTKTKKLTFKPAEMKLVKQFIIDEKDSKVWGWFIEMFLVMIETGVRISELCNMRINQIEPSTKTWTFKGKGKFGGKERVQRFTPYIWEMISYLIVDEKGLLRTDKEFVFHQKYYKPYGKDKYGDSKMICFEDINKGFTTMGFRNKFYKMVNHLKLTKGLSPHACRRYFITEMLKKTNGDIPLVAQLVGHSSWDMVKLYAQSLVTEKTDTNIGLFAE